MALWLGANQGTLKGDPGPSQACSGHFSTAWLTAKRPADPEPRKSDCAQDKSVFGEAEEQKCSTPVYPWMQRMNSCNSE